MVDVDLIHDDRKCCWTGYRLLPAREGPRSQRQTVVALDGSLLKAGPALCRASECRTNPPVLLPHAVLVDHAARGRIRGPVRMAQPEVGAIGDVVPDGGPQEELILFRASVSRRVVVRASKRTRFLRSGLFPAAARTSDERLDASLNIASGTPPASAKAWPRRLMFSWL